MGMNAFSLPSLLVTSKLLDFSTCKFSTPMFRPLLPSGSIHPNAANWEAQRDAAKHVLVSVY